MGPGASVQRQSVEQRDPSGEGLRRKATRRRTLEENARRGESKIGRVAGLRPGRITLKPVQMDVPKPDQKVLEPTVKGPCDTRIARSGEHVSGESSWNSDDHSTHSNRLHHDAQLAERATREGDREEARASQATEYYMNDFYTRNPSAKANGWLALPHHRDLVGGGKGGGKRRMDMAARG